MKIRGRRDVIHGNAGHATSVRIPADGIFSRVLYTPAVKPGIHWLISSGILLLSMVGCNAGKPTTVTVAAPALERLPQGDYLSSTYSDVLKRTRSPYQAGKTGEVSLVVLQRQPSKLLLNPILNLHEGRSTFVVNRNGSLATAEFGAAEAQREHNRGG